jgi:hypothetical protein
MCNLKVGSKMVNVLYCNLLLWFFVKQCVAFHDSFLKNPKLFMYYIPVASRWQYFSRIRNIGPDFRGKIKYRT